MFSMTSSCMMWISLIINQLDSKQLTTTIVESVTLQYVALSIILEWIFRIKMKLYWCYSKVSRYNEIIGSGLQPHYKF